MKLKQHKIDFLKETVKPDFLEAYIQGIENRGVSKGCLIRCAIHPKHSICGDWVKFYVAYNDFEKDEKC